MPTYEIEGPGGKTYEIDGPPGATREQIIAKVQAGLSSQPAAAPVQQPQGGGPSGIVDSIRALPGGIAKGAASILGLPRDASDLLDAGVQYVGNKMSPGAGDRAVEFSHDNSLGRNLVGAAPGSKQINDTISGPFGGYYKPQTLPGQYTETVASFAPNALMPGSLPMRAARVAAPGVASETAGQATKGKPYEPLARAAGAAAGGFGVGAVEGALNAKRVPSLEELGQAKTAAYKAADQAGVVISPQSFQKFATDLGTDITANNVVQADIHPHTLAALKVLQEEAASGVPMSLSRADAVRQAVNGAIEKAAGASGSKTDLRLAMKVRAGLDDYLEKLTPSDTLVGNASVAVPILKEARGLAQREMKGQEIQKLIDLAENQASTNYSSAGMEQALRVQFKNLNAKLIKEPSLAKTFTPEERDAIAKVARGGAVGNALRWLGKFSANGSVQTGVASNLGLTTGGGLGYILSGGNPMVAAGAGMAGSAAALGTGSAARAGATALTMRNAQNAGALMRAGPQAASTMTNPGVTNLALPLLLSRPLRP